MNYHILGKGGFAREVAGILYDKYGMIYYDECDRVKFYEDGELSAVQQLLIDDHEGVTLIGVGSPKLKKKFAEQLEQTKLRTPHLFAKTAIERDYNLSNQICEGTIVCDGVVITTNIKIGKFVTINLNTTIGHDTEIGDFTTIHPGCNISGNVKIGKGCEIGCGTVIIPGIELPDNGVVGAGAVITKTPDLNFNKNYTTNIGGVDVQPFKNGIESYMMAGNPARIIKVNGVRVD